MSNSKLLKYPTYRDLDTMPFGKYKGELLQDVPVSYLHWWYHETDADNISLKHYIENSLNALKLENTNLIWRMK